MCFAQIATQKGGGHPVFKLVAKIKVSKSNALSSVYYVAELGI